MCSAAFDEEPAALTLLVNPELSLLLTLGQESPATAEHGAASITPGQTPALVATPCFSGNTVFYFI